MGSLGRRYATALLSIARDEARLDERGHELRTIAAVFGEPRLAAVVANPTLDDASRRDLVDRVLDAAHASPTVANLVRLLAERERLVHLPDIARAYDALVDRELGRVRVAIRSAGELPDDMQRDLTALARQLARKEIIVDREVDPELLGGVVLDVGGTVFDGSVRTQLERLNKTLREGGR